MENNYTSINKNNYYFLRYMVARYLDDLKKQLKHELTTCNGVECRYIKILKLDIEIIESILFKLNRSDENGNICTQDDIDVLLEQHKQLMDEIAVECKEMLALVNKNER